MNLVRSTEVKYISKNPCCLVGLHAKFHKMAFWLLYAAMLLMAAVIQEGYGNETTTERDSVDEGASLRSYSCKWRCHPFYVYVLAPVVR